MTTWVISVSEDGCETQLTALENLELSPKLNLDTEGDPMIEVKRFEAETWEEAKAVRDQWFEEQK